MMEIHELNITEIQRSILLRYRGKYYKDTEFNIIEIHELNITEIQS